MNKPDDEIESENFFVLADESDRGFVESSLADQKEGVVFPRPTTVESGKTAVAGALKNFGNRMLTGDIDVLVCLSASGLRWLVDSVARTIDRQRFIDGLQDIKTVSAGDDVTNALTSLGVQPTVRVGAACHWRDVVMVMDRELSLTNLSVALEVNRDVHGLAAAMEARGASVVRLTMFDLPEIEAISEQWQQTFTELEPGGPEQATFFVFRSMGPAIEMFASARHMKRSDWLVQHLAKRYVIAFSDDLEQFLTERGVRVDLCVDENGFAHDDDTMSDSSWVSAAKQNWQQKKKTQINMALSIEPDTTAAWYDSPFMRACRGEPCDVTPIWMMRQAGRYMAEYREVRAKVSFLELCARPDLCSEVMCTAVERLGVDAAIIFSDLLPILVPMGCDLEFVKGDGPKIHNPVREPADIDRIRPLENMDELQFVVETVRQTRRDLPAHLPLIGFAGAPFTLASYMIEGGASRNYENTKRLMFTDPGAWDELMTRLSDSIALYLNHQVIAGAQCLQLFDSWAGCLSFDAYRQFVLPYVQSILQRLPENVPVINFATGNPALLPHLADTRASVIGIDWRVRLDQAWETVGHSRSVQGNLDPTILLTDPATIRTAVQNVLDQAGGRPGHIFNLGHGILPMTPVENAIALVDIVHELSQK